MNHSQFAEGDRVSISWAYHWAKGAKGTVCLPPAVVVRIAGDWQGVHRQVDAVKGPISFYWVYFDTPQTDADGDGPFVGAEIDAAYLRADAEGDGLAISIEQGNLQAVWYENKKLGKKVEFKVFMEDELT